MLTAVRFEILRDVPSNNRKGFPLTEKPVRVCTMIDEDAFNATHQINHRQTVFMDDEMHDWHWRDGRFYFHARSGLCDVLIVYEEVNVRYDPMTGKPQVVAAR